MIGGQAVRDMFWSIELRAETRGNSRIPLSMQFIHILYSPRIYLGIEEWHWYAARGPHDLVMLKPYVPQMLFKNELRR